MSYLTDQQLDSGALAQRINGAYQAKTANYTMLISDAVTAIDTTGGAVTLTLPAASASTGKTLRIIKTGGANVLTVQRAGSDTILPSSGARTSVAFPPDCANGEILLVSSGTAWEVLEGRASDETVGSRLYEWSQAKAATSTTAAVGWSLVYFNSGWRDVTGALETGASAGIFNIRRSLDRVSLETFNVNWVTAIYVCPAGFRPSYPGNNKVLPIARGDGLIGVLTYGTAGANALSMSATFKSYGGLIVPVSFTADSALPTSLPGTAA